MDVSVQPLLKLEEGSMEGIILPCFLQQMLELSNIFINILVLHSKIGQFPISPLLRGGVCEGLLEFLPKLDPQTFIVGAVHQGYPI